MNVLDESIANTKLPQIERMGIRARKIGRDLGRTGMQDDEIVSLLHGLARPTFFTWDEDFYTPRLRHGGYSLVWLDVALKQTAVYIRRLLRHPDFNTEAKRLGSVIRVSPGGLHYWALTSQSEQTAAWLERP